MGNPPPKNLPRYTPGSSNIAVAGKWGPRMESMYFLLNMVIFQPAMLVYQRVSILEPENGGPLGISEIPSLETIISRFHVNFWGCIYFEFGCFQQ